MSNIPVPWDREEAWCGGCRCLAELCECPSLESQLQASVEALEDGAHIVSRFDLPSEAQLVAVDAQLSRLLREGPPQRSKQSA